MLDGWSTAPWTQFNRDILEDGIDIFLIEFHRLEKWVSAVHFGSSIGKYVIFSLESACSNEILLESLIAD